MRLPSSQVSETQEGEADHHAVDAFQAFRRHPHPPALGAVFHVLPVSHVVVPVQVPVEGCPDREPLHEVYMGAGSDGAVPALDVKMLELSGKDFNPALLENFLHLTNSLRTTAPIISPPDTPT